MKQFILKDTIGVYGNQSAAIQAMMDYEYLCGKIHTSLTCIIIPDAASSQELYFFGNKEIAIPVHHSIDEAVKELKFSVLVNFASARSAFQTTKDAIQSDCIEKIIVIAEGMPEREARILRALAKDRDKLVIGPATVGGVVAGIMKIGNAGGTTENVIEHELFKRGHVGIVSKSGGMLNELMTIASRNTDGICEAFTTGGDRFPITTLADQILHFEENPDIRLILLFGELGGMQEYEVIDLIKQKKVKKPVIAWISGSSGSALGEQMQFGHAGARAYSTKETTEEKVQALRKVGVIIPDSFDNLEACIAKEAKKLKIEKISSLPLPPMPQDFEVLLRRKEIRYKKNIVTSISKKVGNDETYVGRAIADVAKNKSIGYLLGLMWFKTEFPLQICEVFETIIKVVADHGPAVSGAHNTIVTARAGKDLVSSLVSGLLTIGPRFGGAVNDSAKYIKWGCDTALSPFDFVEEMKQKGILLPGIGHKVKSKTNPDNRVLLLISQGRKATKKHTYLDYALAIEEVTTRKKDSLILNVDGAIAGILLDILTECMNSDAIDNLIADEALNAFFVLGRSIGLIAHFIDQKRLDQPLYRHPDWDIYSLD